MTITKTKYPPGDFAIWLVIYMELFTFGALFVGYAFTRRLHVDLFNESQLLLDQRAGLVNTFVLITSSWFIVKALQAIKEKTQERANTQGAKWLLAALGCGSIFLVIKVMEFAAKYEAGITLSTNTFFMFYFILTVFHFLHVLLGMIILFNLYQNTRQGRYSSENHRGLETGALYWHMVDLLWIVLFPLVYIIR